MVDIENIPDFPGRPGQRPTPGAPSAVSPVAVVLVTAPLDREYRNIALNRAAVDTFIAAEIAGGRAYETTVERWSPWSSLQLQLSYQAAAVFNYARFTIGTRAWYAFLDADYLNLTDSIFTPAADAWTTYGPSVGYSTVRRGHVAVAAASGGDIGYCLEPEDFTPGDLVGYSAYQPDPLGTPRVLVISTTDLRADPFVQVDDDTANTAADNINSVLVTGAIEGRDPLTRIPFSYSVGSSAYDDLLYYPYAASAGLAPGNTMFRPRAVGATPSLVDGIPAEGGAFLYSSVGAAVTHLSKLAHTPWIADGIQRAILVPGGSGGGLGPVDLSPRDAVPDTSGSPSYQASFSTAIDYDTTLAADWTSGLPSAYGDWTKLRTAPYSGIKIADRMGSTTDHDPQAVTGLGSLRLHFEGVFHPDVDVASWIVGAGGTSAPSSPTTVPLGVELPHFAVGRDSVVGPQAAGLSAERSQSIVELLTAMQRAGVDNSFTQSSAYTAAQYALAEAI